MTHPPVDLDLNPGSLGLVTDLYQLTMMAGFHGAGLDQTSATFELFVRRLPTRRSYLIFAGLEQAIANLMSLRFSEEQVEALRGWPGFSKVPADWFDKLLGFQFTGDVWAVPEGSAVFAGEPLLRVTALLPQAQLVETMLLGTLGYPTLVASKAARIATVARGRGLIDFGARRGHGLQASFACARSSYIAGFSGTSQAEAARRLGIPAIGTMAHSWVQAFETEVEAFDAFSRQFPGSTILVDTYETGEGVRLAAMIDPPIRAVRIDSGNLLVESRRARDILDSHDRSSVQITLSGNLDEDSIDLLVRAGAPVDHFGVGTELITCGGAPTISMVYKLVESNKVGRVKTSVGKQTYPFTKQIVRQRSSDGKFASDLVIGVDEQFDGELLLEPVLIGGRLIGELPSLDRIRARVVAQLEALPDHIRDINADGQYPVVYSEFLQAEATRLGAVHSPPSSSFFC